MKNLKEIIVDDQISLYDEIKSQIGERLYSYGFNDYDILERYNESHRYYHTIDHIINMIYYTKKLDSDINLFLAIVFHDIIYDPKRNDNEERSVEYFKKEMIGSKFYDEESVHFNTNFDADLICKMIMDTKNHEDTTGHSQPLIDADLEIFKGDFKELLETEEQIFKEYQFVDWNEYKKKRIQVLTELDELVNSEERNENIEDLIEYIENEKPNIGVYCGSFYPFHKGHLNILEKAEKIFDKVIIGYGDNPSKNYDIERKVPSQLYYHQVEFYGNDMIKFLEKLGYEVTLIRGLRSSTDFQSELNLYRWLQEFKPDVKVIYIFCDSKYEHISSSDIRNIIKMGRDSKFILK